MAKLYRKKYPIPMPQGAEIVTRRGRKFAQWIDGYGTLKTAPLSDDGKKIMHEAGCWYARFTDADGVRRRISTNCNDMQAAQKVLADLMAKVEKIKSGIITPAEAQTAEHCQAAVEDHVADYLRHLSIKLVRGRPVSRQYIKNVKGRLERLIRECKFKCLRDFNCQTVEQWLADAADNNLSAATRNEYLTSIAAFGSWAVRHGRMTANIFKAIGKADRNLDHRRMRRALAASEVAALLNAAAIRPLAECGRPSVKLDDGEWTYATIDATNLKTFHDRAMEKLQDHPRRIERFQRLGRQRALFYHIAVTTGLRRREIASLTLGQIHLDGVTPHIELHGIDSKNAKNANIPLREELVLSIRRYIQEVFGGDAPLTTKLFSHVPTIRVFDADLQAAGIAKSDHRDRTVDIHALRHTFGTHLSVAGVTPRVAQAAMRHSRIELTMNLYTDPALLDIAGAVKSLPNFVAKERVTA